MTVNYPTSTQRISIIGRTGSGKTVAGVWHLSRANFHLMPWLIYDFKRDSLLADIADLEGAEHIGLDELPRRPGLYFVHPHPDDSEAVQAQLWRIWHQEDTGVYVDEGYMVCGARAPNRAFRSILTQGRSKQIPVITLSQRPCWLDLFVFSEADFYQVFSLNYAGDQRTVMEYVRADIRKELPRYHSYYYDVAENQTVVMKPVPTDEEILKRFDARLQRMKTRTRRIVV